MIVDGSAAGLSRRAGGAHGAEGRRPGHADRGRASWSAGCRRGGIHVGREWPGGLSLEVLRRPRWTSRASSSTGRASRRCCRSSSFSSAHWRSSSLPVSEYPEVAPPQIVVRAQYPRCKPARHQRDGGHAAGGADQRHRGLALLRQPGHRRWPDDADGDVQGRHQPGTGRDLGAEPRQPRAAAPAGDRAPDRRHHREAGHQLRHGGAPAVTRQPLRRALPAQLRAAQHPRRAAAHPRHRHGDELRLRRLRHAGLARPEQARFARPDRQAMW